MRRYTAACLLITFAMLSGCGTTGKNSSDTALPSIQDVSQTDNTTSTSFSTITSAASTTNNNTKTITTTEYKTNSGAPTSRTTSYNTPLPSAGTSVNPPANNSDVHTPSANNNTATGSNTTAQTPSGNDTPVQTVPGFTYNMFQNSLNGIQTFIHSDFINQTGTVDGVDYYLTIDLSKWDENTSPEQIVTLSSLFWYAYPKMYRRFNDISDAPTNVTLAIENEGYGIAEAGGDHVHLHDMWLNENPDDYDCITHELAHIIQSSGWGADYLEDPYYVELFADLCRYEYAFNSGTYNDSHWTLEDAYTKDSHTDSIRFFVWLDYTYSNGGKDVLRDFFRICHDESFSADDWDSAWQQIFDGTPLAGLSVDEVWDMFLDSDFAYLSTESMPGSKSELLEKYDVRTKADRLAQR